MCESALSCRCKDLVNDGDDDSLKNSGGRALPCCFFFREQIALGRTQEIGLRLVALSSEIKLLLEELRSEGFALLLFLLRANCSWKNSGGRALPCCCFFRDQIALR